MSNSLNLTYTRSPPHSRNFPPPPSPVRSSPPIPLAQTLIPLQKMR
ncbi:hypothetical protein [Leptolyngbya sp. ST-U4]